MILDVYNKTSQKAVAAAKQPPFSLASLKSHCDALNNVRLARFELARLKFDSFAAATK